MPATKLDVRRWFDDGIKLNATYMILAADASDHEDYPVYVFHEDNVHEKINEVRMSPMQRVMEIYDLNMDRTKQLNEQRSFNFPQLSESKSDSD